MEEQRERERWMSARVRECPSELEMYSYLSAELFEHAGLPFLVIFAPGAVQYTVGTVAVALAMLRNLQSVAPLGNYPCTCPLFLIKRRLGIEYRRREEERREEEG